MGSPAAPQRGRHLTTVDEARACGRRRLSPSPTAGLDSDLLLAHTLSVSRAWILAHGDDPLAEESRVRYLDLVRLRAAGRPVAYLRGFVEWMDLTLEVTPDVLIPRPETELLAERAAAVIRHGSISSVADIGTGSGALAIALARVSDGVAVEAIDISRQAVDVALSNVRRYGLGDRIAVRQGHLLDALSRRPDLLVANLPYLSTAMMGHLPPDVRHEPPAALHGGRDGLTLYRQMVGQLQVRGWRIPMVLELDPRQVHEATSLVRETWLDAHTTIDRDYAGHERILAVDL